MMKLKKKINYTKGSKKIAIKKMKIKIEIKKILIFDGRVNMKIKIN